MVGVLIPDPAGSDPVFLIAVHDEPVSAAGDRTLHRENDVSVSVVVYVSDDRIIDDGTQPRAARYFSAPLMPSQI